MTDQPQIMAFECPSEEISAYIDGELSGVREFELEAHFAVCDLCSFELNQQKQFLCGLNSSLKQEGEIELPANFTKLIVANAESTVSGLRRPREVYNAVFICVGLFLFVLFASGADASRVFAGISTLFEQITAVGGFFGHLVYSVFVGVAIILRSLATQFRADMLLVAAFTVIACLMLLVISRKILRIRRA